jgi:hypothetical protein
MPPKRKSSDPTTADPTTKQKKHKTQGEQAQEINEEKKQVQQEGKVAAQEDGVEQNMVK